MQYRKPITAIVILLSGVIAANGGRSAKAQERLEDWPAGVKAKSVLESERAYQYEFSEIDVARLQWWLKAVRLKLPVQLKGNLSGWFWAQRSAAGWFDFENYKIEVGLRSPALNIDEWLVSNAQLRFGYANENWYVGKLSGNVRSPVNGKQVGTVDLHSKIPTVSKSKVVFAADINAVNLHELLLSLGIKNEVFGDGSRVQLTGSLPLNAASDLTKWDARAEVETGALKTPWIETPSKASATFDLADGKWTLTSGRIQVAKQDVSVSGSGSLDADFPFEFFANGKEMDVGQLLVQIKLGRFAKTMAGLASLNAAVKGNQKNGIAIATATIESKSLSLDSNTIENLTLTTIYSPKRIRLSIGSGDVADGRISGFSEWANLAQITTEFPNITQLKVESVDLNKIKISAWQEKLSGELNGELAFETIIKNKITSLASTGQLNINRLCVIDQKLGDLSLGWSKESSSNELIGRLSLNHTQGSLGAKFVGIIEPQIDSAFKNARVKSLQAEGVIDDYPIQFALGQDGSTIAALSLVGSFDINGSHSNLLGNGELSLSKSSILISKQKIQLEQADISFDPNEFRFEKFKLQDSVGNLTGSAVIRRRSAGNHSLQLNASDLNLKTYLAKLVPQLGGSIGGVLNADIALTKDATQSDLLRDWRGIIEANVKRISLSGKQIGGLYASGIIDDQVVTATADGKLLSGNAKMSAKFPLSMFRGGGINNHNKINFTADIKGIEARQIAALFFREQRAKSFAGTASIQLNASHNVEDGFSVAGNFESQLIRNKRKTLARDFVAKFLYAKNKLSIERVSGGVADGRIDIKGQLGFEKDRFKPTSGRLNVAAQRVDVASLLTIFTPDYSAQYEGRVGFRGAMDFNRGMTFDGQASVENGSVIGIPLQNVHGQVRAEFNQKGAFKQLVSNNLHGKGYGGTLDAKLKIIGGSQVGLTTSGKITRGGVEQLSKSMGFEKIVGHGAFDGRFEVQSKKIASLNALEGNVWVKFDNGDARTIPLVAVVDRFVPLIPFASTKVDDGYLNARLKQGLLRIGEMQLNGRSFMLKTSGDIALNGTSLDLETVIFTGSKANQRLAEAAIKRIVIKSVPQLAAIAELNDLLRNRTVYLHIGGQPSRPVIQPKVGKTAVVAILQNLSQGVLQDQNAAMSNQNGK